MRSVPQSMPHAPRRRPLAAGVATAAGWLAMVIGAVHILFTVRAYARPSLGALWFAGSGVAVVLIGTLTLLARSMPVRGVATGGNAAGLALAVAFGMLTGWRAPQGPVLVAVFLAGGAAAWWMPATSRSAADGREGGHGG